MSSPFSTIKDLVRVVRNPIQSANRFIESKLTRFLKHNIVEKYISVPLYWSFNSKVLVNKRFFETKHFYYNNPFKRWIKLGRTVISEIELENVGSNFNHWLNEIEYKKSLNHRSNFGADTDVAYHILCERSLDVSVKWDREE